ncbi:zinc finger protein 490-like [Battus philenor]|uniref:zinc finger protein 490-like n=1 Tax=Battus philenor TaxID=42288 RepID=UPI0035CF228F
MVDIKVCRICLVTDVNMHDLQSYPLGTYFEPITGINPLNMADLPPFACFECASLIKKFYFFRERCLRGQAALYGILHTSGKITKEDVQQIDRQYFHLTSNLSICNKRENNEFDFTHDEAKSNLVKEEPFDEVESAHDYIETDDVKEESNFDDITSHATLSSDDNEPLSLHKSNKEKKIKKRVVKKKIRKTQKKEQSDEKLTSENKLDDSLNIIETTDDSSVLPTEIKEAIKTKPKRGRPRKTDAPIEAKQQKSRRTKNTGGVDDDEMDIEEYVTVIKLTVEQQIEEITKRKQSSNYLNAPFQCNLCYKGFIDTHAWRHHVGKHDPSAGELECSICKFRFKTKRTLQKHVTNHEKKYACKSCPYVSKTTTQAKQHQRWHKGVTYKCQYCDEISTKWTSYLSHVRIKHPSQHICGACGYSFVSRLGLAMHRTMMHKDLAEKVEAEDSKEEGPYCEQCDVKFVSAEAWKRHMVTSVRHTQSTDFNTGCRVCGETFKSAEELRLHHRREHARKRPKNYGKKPSNLAWPTECEHCSEEIANARDYWTHFRRVHPDKNYPIQKNYICDICGKSFRGNAFLVYHKRTHSEERAYKCAQCPKAFFNRTNLQMHERTHSDVRPHPCTVCCKAFKCKGALDRHSRSHTGVKPYECEVCGKAFAQSNSRKLHVRTVHLKQPSPYVSRSRLERRARLSHQIY